MCVVFRTTLKNPFQTNQPPPLHQIQKFKQQTKQEFHPYVFQILAQLIELSPRPLQPAYMAVFPPLLAPLYWERPGNVPPLTRLLQAYLAKAGDLVVSGGHLPPLLGVFQKLIASKVCVSLCVLLCC
jgi:exportin-2 (importin alpha re-exporter)